MGLLLLDFLTNEVSMTVTVSEARPAPAYIEFDDKKMQLLRDTICKSANEDEFQLFAHACKRTGLDPFMRQVYMVPRWDNQLKRNAMTIQTGIDGYRLIADRTGKYCPGKESTFIYKQDGSLLYATSFVKKLTNDGTWHEISSSAYWDEYCQKTKDGNPSAMWAKMPHVMLAKVAEALALRKAFPADLSGIYTSDEMQQAEIEVTTPQKQAPKPIDMTPINAEQLKALTFFIDGDEDYFKSVMERLAKLKIMRLEDIPIIMFTKVLDDAKKNFEKREEARMLQQAVDE